MTDIVNAYFHRFYPPDATSNWHSRWGPLGSTMRELFLAKFIKENLPSEPPND